MVYRVNHPCALASLGGLRGEGAVREGGREDIDDGEDLGGTFESERGEGREVYRKGVREGGLDVPQDTALYTLGPLPSGENNVKGSENPVGVGAARGHKPVVPSPLT